MTGKRFNVIRDVGIEDGLTGEVSSTYRALCTKLNKESERADEIAEELWEFKKLMMKYEIDSIEKLDLVLMEQRVW